MCLVALALDHDPRFPLVIATNRDEFFARPTAPLGWWTDEAGTPILGGRDLDAGGTWLGLTARGRLALVTNVRDPARHDVAAPSRGRIVPGWLRDAQPVEPFLDRVQRGGYNGVNLLAFDFPRGLRLYATNDGSPPRPLAPGVHGLSNASLDTPWPKVVTLQARLQAALDAHLDVDGLAAALFAALGDARLAPADALPSTGIPRELERQLSAAFIRTPDGRYGTRSSTLVITERAGGRCTTHVIERTHAQGDGPHVDRRETLPAWPPAAPAGDAGRTGDR